MITLVSSVLLRLPAAHTKAESVHLIRHTTPKQNQIIRSKNLNFILRTLPPFPIDSSDTRFRIKSPVFKFHNFTVPSSPELTT